MTASSPADAHLGIDLGTSSVKVVLVSEHGDQVAHADAGYAVNHPKPGWAESAPLDWWNAVRTAVGKALATAPGVNPVSIGPSGQMHGVVPTRRNGAPVGAAILWADSRAEEQLQVYRSLPSSTRHRLANPLSPGMAGPIVAWLIRHERESAASMRWALQPRDWLRLQLTGETHTEPSTGIQIVTPSDQPPRGATDPVTHYYRAATDKGHYRLAAMLNGGLALNWVRELLGASWAELYSVAERAPQDRDPIFLPQLNGERTPYMDASMRGAWTGLTPQHGRADLLRSALEGVAFGTAEALAALFPDGLTVDHLRLAGGGTAAPGWRQMLADALEVELRAVAVPGASGRGAAFLGARAAGLMDEPRIVEVGTPAVTSVVRPRPEAAARYRERRTRFRDAVDLLRSANP